MVREKIKSKVGQKSMKKKPSSVALEPAASSAVTDGMLPADHPVVIRPSSCVHHDELPEEQGDKKLSLKAINSDHSVGHHGPWQRCFQ